MPHTADARGDAAKFGVGVAQYESRDTLDAWHRFEEETTRRPRADWCVENG